MQFDQPNFLGIDPDKPLNQHEKDEYVRLKTKLDKAVELSEYDSDRCTEFELREARPADLAKFRAETEEDAFNSPSDYQWIKFEIFNLPAKAQRYEHFKKQYTTPSAQLAFIVEERLRQLALKKQAESRANLLWGGRDKTKEGIKLDVIHRVYEEFEQYLQLEEKRLQQDLSAAKMSTDIGATSLKTMRRIVLLHIYQNITIPHGQANAIAANYGFFSPTSGQKLYGTYNKLAHQVTARTGVEARGLKSMIADITAVLPHLADSGRKQAERELQTLKAQK